MRPTLALLALLVPAAPLAAQGTTKAAFLGNSYTNSNGTVFTVRDLAAAAGHPMEVAKNTPGGCTLGAPHGGVEHVSNPTSQALITSNAWDFVVLQEQSTLPTDTAAKNAWMLPGGQALDAAIAAHDPTTRTILFQTWGRENGGQFCWIGCSPNFPDFDAMQDVLTASYAELGGLLHAQVAPVGEAWRLAFQQDPTVQLHSGDGSHPSTRGSYLAACVLFATMFGESPVGNAHHAGLPAADAAFLQQVAAEAIWGPTCGFADFGVDASQTLALAGADVPGPGGQLTLTAAGLPAGATGWFLAASLAKDELPLLGGTVLVDLAQLLAPPVFVPAGSPFVAALPTSPAFTGVRWFFQSVAADPATPGQLAWSNGLRYMMCP